MVTTLALLGKLTISASYQIIFLHSGELFPTEVRTWGMGNSSTMARIGSVCGSFLISALVSLAWVWVWVWGYVVLGWCWVYFGVLWCWMVWCAVVCSIDGGDLWSLGCFVRCGYLSLSFSLSLSLSLSLTLSLSLFCLIVMFRKKYTTNFQLPCQFLPLLLSSQVRGAPPPS